MNMELGESRGQRLYLRYIVTQVALEAMGHVKMVEEGVRTETRAYLWGIPTFRNGKRWRAQQR